MLHELTRRRRPSGSPWEGHGRVGPRGDRQAACFMKVSESIVNDMRDDVLTRSGACPACRDGTFRPPGAQLPGVRRRRRRRLSRSRGDRFRRGHRLFGGRLGVGGRGRTTPALRLRPGVVAKLHVAAVVDLKGSLGPPGEVSGDLPPGQPSDLLQVHYEVVLRRSEGGVFLRDFRHVAEKRSLMFGCER